ncbi:MAG: Kelch repeat-containing protein, partial [Gaiellaceae bacterium]
LSLLNDLWALSLSGSPDWTQLAPSGTPPSQRYAHTAIYDPVRDRMVVFGGYDNTVGLVNDVWSLSLAGSPAWAQLAPSGTPPVAREWHSAIYDPVRDRMLVFGGTDGLNLLGDVWSLALAGGTAWSQVVPTGSPGVRDIHSAIYDPIRDRMVVFAGGGDSGDLNDVWALSLTGTPAWTQLAPTGAPPGARDSHSAIYDPVRDRMVIYGGEGGLGAVNDLWSMSLAGIPAWTQLAPTGIVPDPGYSQTAIYYPSLDRMVIFGGGTTNVLNDVHNLTWNSALGVPPRASAGELSLAPAYPNPARGEASIEFALPREGAASLRIFDLSGRSVATLVNGSLAAGHHSIHWDGREASGGLAKPGLYFYELRANGRHLARRLVLMR